MAGVVSKVGPSKFGEIGMGILAIVSQDCLFKVAVNPALTFDMTGGCLRPRLSLAISASEKMTPASTSPS